MDPPAVDGLRPARPGTEGRPPPSCMHDHPSDRYLRYARKALLLCEAWRGPLGGTTGVCGTRP